jgi:heptosyltransferase-3
VKWGPWPKDWKQASSPWPWRGGGHQGNVRLIQGSGDCVPCLLEGCDRHLNSLSRCLQDIPVDSVLLAAQAMLEESGSARRVHFIGEHGAQP